MKKRILALLLSMTLVLTTGTLTFAEDSAENINTEQSSGNTISQTAIEGQNTTRVENITNPENGTSSSTASINPEQQLQTINTTEPQVGDTVWIKSGSTVYSSTTDSVGYVLKLSHDVTIKDIITESNGVIWYRVEYDFLSNFVLYSYPYVLAQNTSVDEPNAPSGEVSEKVDNTEVKVSGVPEENTTLSVGTVKPSDFHEDLFDQDKMGSHKLAFALDITLKNNGNEWQPEAGNKVTVTIDTSQLDLPENTSKIGILHEHDGELKNLGVYEIQKNELTFATDGFSEFYGYTVDFEYDGTWHSIGGGGNIYLYELFAQLGIERSTSEVTDVSFTNDDLLKVSKVVVDGYTGEEDWYIESLAPFDTEEIMTITFQDGGELKINVYDAAYTTLSNNLQLNNGDTINNTTVSGNVTLTLNGTVTIKGQITIKDGASLKIIGSGTLKREDSYTGRLFSVEGNGSLEIVGLEENPIVIDGSAEWTSSRVEDSTRYNITVKKGDKVESAAIYVDSKKNSNSVTLTNVTMKNLYTEKGQAPVIYATGTSVSKDVQTIDYYATINLSNVKIQNCATMSGLAITLFNDSIVDLENCEYSGNYSGGMYSGTLKAGGPSNFSQLTMNKCSANNNYSSGWGGVLLWAANSPCKNMSSKATITNCNFEDNIARYLGGALSNEAIMEVSNTVIQNNTAMAGGGIATFPFTRTEYDAQYGGNACGLTLGTGNTIQENYATAEGEFTPYSIKDENGSNVKGDDTVLDEDRQIIYTGGGGGIWCYMNKDKWTCSLEIGAGNTIQKNEAKNVGGAVYVDKVAGSTTTLSITGANIQENTATNGGGVAVKNADVKVSDGMIQENKATQFGGGIHVESGVCTVSGKGEVHSNTANNGGGIYLESGTLNVTGGIITKNKAIDSDSKSTVNNERDNNETAKDRKSGVGGGIYVKKGTFTLNSDANKSVSIYGNLADFAADDAYASGDDTTLTLPDVTNMKLEGDYSLSEGWYMDYVKNDSNYKSLQPFTYDNDGRYRSDNNNDHATGSITEGKTYYCLTLGRIPSLVITKVLSNCNTAPEESFVFKIKRSGEEFMEVLIPASAFKQSGKDMQASVAITRMQTGEYTVEEVVDWDWRYEFVSAKAETASVDNNTNEKSVAFNLTTSGENVVFTNKLSNSNWLSGDTHCRNWWGDNGNVKRIASTSKNN